MERRRRELDPMTKVRRRDKPRERWLLTRKTWRYMSDAGRRLVPDGVQNRADDVPRIEAYFQEVCAREPRFLLWRKSSYPGAVPKPKRRKRRGGSVRARDSTDDVPPPPRPADLYIGHVSGGRFDIAKLRRDFFATPPQSNTAANLNRQTTGASANSRPSPVEEEETSLVDLLRRYLRVEDDSESRSEATKLAEAEEVVRELREYFKRQGQRAPFESDGDPTQRILHEHLGRRYLRSSSRDRAVQDLLTDKNLLKRLYHDLRKTKPYRGGRSGGIGPGSSGFGAGGFGGVNSSPRLAMRPKSLAVGRFKDDDELRFPPMSPPPLIEVCHESAEDKYVDCGTQTRPIPEEVLQEIERTYREKLEAATAPTSPTSPPPERKPARRRSSVDHDDVSQSVSDTIKRYLRMARKKSVDSEKVDRFKRINYDKNLRNIKPREPGEVDDDGPHKGCQTEEGWILTYRDLQFASVSSTPTSPTSPPSPASQTQSFLSTLLGRGTQVCPGAGGMQKSRSSSSVVQSVSKRLWRTRSRSSSRVSATWTPQGSCCWVDGAGRCVRLVDTSLLTLTEVERKALQQAALARLQQINLGTHIKIPEENATVPTTKPKRRAYLLKRKAVTMGFFDQSRTRENDKDKESTSGSVFGVPLTQCVETERALRRQHGGSRASLASLGALEKGDDSESCDSGDWGWSGLEEGGGGGPRVPALVSACLSHLRRNGLHTVGLFRVSSSKKRVRQLREEYERCQEAALDSAVCPHDVATLLKEFLRDLPDPLLCRDLYSVFLQTQKLHNHRYQWEALRHIVQLLPAAHRDTLNALLSFLAQLATHSEDAREPGNKMDAANLATIFAPNILHKNKPNEPASVEQLSERADVINVVRLLVERQSELWTLPADLLHEAYIHLAHSAPECLDALLLRRAEQAEANAENTDNSMRQVWSRQECLHSAAATGGPGNVPPASEQKSYRSRRTRETASDTSSGSISSAMTIVTRFRNSEECGSSGVACSTPALRTDSAPDSNDSASDYNETLGGSDDDSCVITASLHIPAAFPVGERRPAVPPRRRSTSGSESSAKRDSAVGSSTPASPASASNTSSPPASPTPNTASPATPLRVTLTSTGEIRRPPDIDKLMALGRERNTSDARAVVLRQHDDVPVRSRASSRQDQLIRKDEAKKDEQTVRTEHREQTVKKEGTVIRKEAQIIRREEQMVRKEERTVKKEGTTLYKRGELISSARSPPT